MAFRKVKRSHSSAQLRRCQERPRNDERSAMGLLSILKKVKEKEKEIRVLML